MGTGSQMPPALTQPSKSDLQPKIIALDLFERLFVIAMFCVFAVANLRISLATDLDIRISMLIVSETLPVLLIVGRPLLHLCRKSRSTGSRGFQERPFRCWSREQRNCGHLYRLLPASCSS
jgi:hypothetical protein